MTILEFHYRLCVHYLQLKEGVKINSAFLYRVGLFDATGGMVVYYRSDCLIAFPKDSFRKDYTTLGRFDNTLKKTLLIFPLLVEVALIQEHHKNGLQSVPFRQ